MSDLGAVKQKLKEGREWRGTINVEIDDEELSLTVRQLVDPELEEVLGLIDRDELKDLRSDYPDDLMDELKELQRADDLDEEESERLSELQEEMEDYDVDMFNVLSQDTFKGIRKAAIYGVEPSDEDLREALAERAHEIEREYGVQVREPEDVKPALQEEWEENVKNATDFLSFQIGMQVLVETVGDEGN